MILYNITEIEAGKSYACKFKLHTLLDDSGYPVLDSTSPISAIDSYESVGVIVKRDVDAQMVEVLDTKRGLRKHLVPFDSVWDVDTVEWIDPDNQD